MEICSFDRPLTFEFRSRCALMIGGKHDNESQVRAEAGSRVELNELGRLNAMNRRGRQKLCNFCGRPTSSSGNKSIDVDGRHAQIYAEVVV